MVFNVRDDYARSLATLRCADVLLINSLRDGMNLVAKEGALLTENAVLVLSRETGAADEMERPRCWLIRSTSRRPQLLCTKR